MKNQRRNVTLGLLSLALILLTIGVAAAVQSGILTFHFKISTSKQTSTNIITNPGFEKGLNSLGYPLGWSFATCEGVANATLSLDSSLTVTGNYSAKIFTGPITNTYCTAVNGTRILGFTQFRQFLPAGLAFTNLTDNSSGFSFWFNLQPYGGATMGGFEVRVLGAESADELDYVFNPTPSLTYPNVTDPNTGAGLRSLLFYGYQFGEWYHFSRDLRADWAVLGLGLTHSFSLLQFEGIAFLNSGTLQSETIWLDEVAVYGNTG